MKVSTNCLKFISTLPKAKFINSQHKMQKLKFFGLDGKSYVSISSRLAKPIWIGMVPFCRQMFGGGAALYFFQIGRAVQKL